MWKSFHCTVYNVPFQISIKLVQIPRFSDPNFTPVVIMNLRIRSHPDERTDSSIYRPSALLQLSNRLRFTAAICIIHLATHCYQNWNKSLAKERYFPIVSRFNLTLFSDNGYCWTDITKLRTEIYLYCLKQSFKYSHSKFIVICALKNIFSEVYLKIRSLAWSIYKEITFFVIVQYSFFPDSCFHCL